ncbi:transporter [Roseivirga misakiensis]|uniref:Transporter n=1 Tax=Roseivirga misakiensis TaxID=1563681 RepID=A0A1E5T153_9BACT|nr:transporter [Roseivirga misakiensis]OEK05108.1 hypothetical protein BFP71_16965 [Roseivirga misakiensis]
MKKTLTILTTLLLALPALAQEETKEMGNIVTDRPTQSVSAFTVGKGIFQVETGFALQVENAFFADFSMPGSMVFPADFQAITYNTTLLRYGISDRVELRFGQNLGRTRVVADGDLLAKSDALFIPTSLGAKVNLLDPVGARPAISFVGQISGPLFSDLELGTDLEFRFNFAHQLNENLSVGYNIGGVVNTNANDNSFTGLYTAVLGYSITPKLAAFAEFFGFLNSGQGQNDHQIDFGLTYLVNSNFQLDVYGGSGLSDISPDTLFGFGFSARIPKN